MTALYVLDIPEFAVFVRAAEAQGLCVARAGDYVEVSGAGRLTITRTQANVRPAVWFAALTGGFQGRLVALDDDRLILDES